MNIIVKTAVASALGLGATGAFAIGVPASGGSDLILVIQNESTPADVYALDTGISINTIFNGPYTSGASLSTALAGINSVIAESATLQSFLAANPAASDGWTLEAAQYAGASTTSSATNQNTKTAGNAKVIFTSIGNPSNIAGATLTNLQQIANGIQGEITTGGLTPLATSTENDTTVSYSTSAATKYGLFSTSDLGALGGTEAIYAYTGNNGTGTPQSYILGSATLGTNGTLTFAQNSSSAPVPVPAALWLFGSGVLGLVGVARRRKTAV
jgi:hypothetical protein